jgi:isoleucyl-tRNA synthetase
MAVPELQMMLQVSVVTLASEFPSIEGWKFSDRIEILGSECQFMISEARSSKCPRCWMYSAEVEGSLCERCQKVMAEKSSSSNSQ